MGKSSSEIQNDIERQRHAIEGRISRLDRRVHDDVDTTKDRVADRLSGTKESIASTGSSVGSKLATTAGSDTPVAEHPVGLVGAAMAGGAALGFLTGGGDDDGSRSNGHNRNGSKSSQQEEERSGIAAGLLGSLLGYARGYIGTQASDVVQTVVDGIKSGASETTDRRKASRVYSGERHLPPAEDEDHPGQRDNTMGMGELETETAGAFQYGGRG
jgi:ElaB/YqjD/DUF883 family membrane-anchored ribosome-binding protein